MNRDLAYAFLTLRVSERAAVMKQVGITFKQGAGESSLDFSTRVLHAVAHDGKVRELEQAMIAYQ